MIDQGRYRRAGQYAAVVGYTEIIRGVKWQQARTDAKKVRWRQG